MKPEYIEIKMDDGRKIKIVPNDSHDVTVCKSPILNRIYIDGMPLEGLLHSVNSVTTIIIHPKGFSIDKITSVIESETKKF